MLLHKFKIRCLRAWRFKSAYWYHFYNPSSFAGVFLCLKKVVSGLERHAGRGTEVSKSPPTGTTFEP